MTAPPGVRSFPFPLTPAPLHAALPEPSSSGRTSPGGTPASWPCETTMIPPFYGSVHCSARPATFPNGICLPVRSLQISCYLESFAECPPTVAGGCIPRWLGQVLFCLVWGVLPAPRREPGCPTSSRSQGLALAGPRGRAKGGATCRGPGVCRVLLFRRCRSPAAGSGGGSLPLHPSGNAGSEKCLS